MVAERHGISEDVALRGSGVSRELLDSANGEVTREQEVVIVSNIVAQLDGSVGVGAEVGMHYHLKTFGVWGFALLSSPTLRSALQTGVQFLDLTFALSRIAVREIEDETRLYFDVSHLPPDIRGFVLERDGLGIRTIQLELLGAVMPLRRIVTQQPGTPEDQELLSQLLQADVTMNAPVTFASFDRDLLDQPVLNSDPTLTKLAVQQCEQALAARRSRVGYAGAVREALIAGRNRWADIGAIAATLHLLAARGRVASATAISPAGFASPAGTLWAGAVLNTLKVLSYSPQPLIRAFGGSEFGRKLLMGSLYAHPERLTPDAFLHDTLGLRRSRGFLAHVVRVPFYRFTKPTAVPTTILWGDRDRVLLPNQAKVAKRRLPDATHASLGHAGHCAQHDVPELVLMHAEATFALGEVARAVTDTTQVSRAS